MTDKVLMYLTPFLITLCLTPVVKYIAIKRGMYAQINERTIHQGKIPRIGGVAIFAGFIISMLMYVNITESVRSILICASLMFIVGLIDDIINLKPRYKLILQTLIALLLIYFGISVGSLHLPFGITINLGVISFIFTLLWVVGITNAVNLIDGLDGLAGGMSSIIFMIIACTALIESKVEIANFGFIMVSAVCGFLVYNEHPASIFMGDCGSLFLGFCISAISLLGFKSSTVMTLALPILILLLPIIDTVSAILRRSLANRSFSSADKKHLHHQLMRRFGQTRSVIIMCAMTMCFGLSAFLYLISKELGLILMCIIIFILEIFIECTDMISEGYAPILTLLHIKVRPKKGEDGIDKEERK